jgi:hypothetical protein
MASTYSTDLRLELIGSGEQSGVWGSTTNLNLGSLVEQAIAGVEAISITSSNQALIAFFGAVDEARNAALILSSGAAANVYVPPVNKVYVVRNSGSFPITMYNSTVIGNTTPAGSGITVLAGNTTSMFTDGSNFYASALPNGSTTGTGSVVYSASPALTGVPTAPTANVGTSTNQIATTAFALANGIPSGAIVLWSGSVASIPSGWLLCNGSSGTPDLRDRFVVGAGSTYAVAATGGSADAIVVSHTHTATVTDSGHTHTTNNAGIYNQGVDSELDYGSGTADPRDGRVVNAATTSSTTGITVSNASTGSSGTNANLPPYYALAYIMKA